MDRPATLEKDGWQIFTWIKVVRTDNITYEKRKMRGQMGLDVFLHLPEGMKEFKVKVRSATEEYFSNTRTKLVLVMEVRDGNLSE